MAPSPRRFARVIARTCCRPCTSFSALSPTSPCCGLNEDGPGSRRPQPARRSPNAVVWRVSGSPGGGREVRTRTRARSTRSLATRSGHGSSRGQRGTGATRRIVGRLRAPAQRRRTGLSSADPRDQVGSPRPPGRREPGAGSADRIVRRTGQVVGLLDRGGRRGHAVPNAAHDFAHRALSTQGRSQPRRYSAVCPTTETNNERCSVGQVRKDRSTSGREQRRAQKLW